MTRPTMREVVRAIADPDAHVVVLTPDGFEMASASNLRPTLADPDREFVILDGEGWAAFAHLMDPERRLTEDRPRTVSGSVSAVEGGAELAPPDRSRESTGGLHEFKRKRDPVTGDDYWIEVREGDD